MPGGYDEMTKRSYPDYTGGPPEARARRDLLRAAMERHGFTVEPNEWWHFNYKDLVGITRLWISFSAIFDSGSRQAEPSARVTSPTRLTSPTRPPALFHYALPHQHASLTLPCSSAASMRSLNVSGP